MPKVMKFDPALVINYGHPINLANFFHFFGDCIIKVSVLVIIIIIFIQTIQVQRKNDIIQETKV